MTVNAPFRFARINRWVWIPEWHDLVTHDVPFKDGVSGTLNFTLTAKSPILIGGARRKPSAAQPGEVRPFQLPDGSFAIPGSTLQGMVRSILEIAAFGKLGPVIDKKRFGLRDLNENAQPFYQARLNKITHGKPPIKIVPRVKSGWLRKNGQSYELLRCEYARIEFSQLYSLTKVADSFLPPQPPKPQHDADNDQKIAWKKAIQAWRKTCDTTISWKKKSDIEERYNWLSSKNICQNLAIDTRREYAHAGGKVKIEYHKVLTGGSELKKGYIVLTGNTRHDDGTKQRNKHMEFFFHTPDTVEKLPDSFEATFQEFLALHAPDDGRKPNPNWVFFNDNGYPDPAKGGPFRDGGWMPIFYLESAPGKIDTFGLAYMFKMAHQSTTHELLRNSAEQHVPDPENADDPAHRPDLASLIFGEKAGSDQTGKAPDHGLKRRAVFDVSLATTRATGPAQTVVLLSPKPSYHPIYVRQTGEGDTLGTYVKANGQPGTKPYATYTPLDGTKFQPEKELDEGHRRPELAGRKIWPALLLDKVNFPPLGQLIESSAENNKIKTTIFTQPVGAQFRCTLRFHNLRRCELGAIIWALCFGETDAPTIAARRHRLGMAKPFGLGAVSISDLALKGTCNDYNEMPSVSELVGCFNDTMTTVYADCGDPDGWNNSVQIAALRKSWDPAQNVPEEFKYMLLDGPHSYVENKSKDQNKFLPNYAQGGEPVQQPPSMARPRTSPPAEGGRPSATPTVTPPPPPGTEPAVGATVEFGDGRTGVVIAHRKKGTHNWSVRIKGIKDEWYPAKVFKVIASPQSAK